MSDETKRRPASENPWYVLMTIAGEQGEDYDDELHAKNRRFWHGWLAQGLDEETKADLIARKVVSADELAPFDADESIYWKNEVARRGVAELPGQKDRVDLSHCDFEAWLSCQGFCFPGYADFADAAFSGGAEFVGAAFSDYANFAGAAFSGYADFGGAAFSRTANFADAAFSDYASFADAAFSIYADFKCAAFPGYAQFERARFSGRADFTSAKLALGVDFEDVVFGGEPPRFFGAELHEDTTWLVKSWPPVPKHPRVAYDHRRAYERLKLLMDSQKKTHDEHMFHRLELKCTESEDGFPANVPSRLYGLVAGYGWSFMRPALGLTAVMVLGWLWMGLWFAISGQCPEPLGGPRVGGCVWSSLGVSVSNTFGFLGLGRSVLKDEIEALDDFGWFEIGAGLQFFLGPVLLFFLFLALRNRYRIR